MSRSFGIGPCSKLFSGARSCRRTGSTSPEHALMLLLQVVEPLVMRHDDLQGAIARMRLRFPAIEAGYRPRRTVDLCVEPDDDHAPCLLAAREAAQLSSDQILDFDL